jgi:hypothetical protein
MDDAEGNWPAALTQCAQNIDRLSQALAALQGQLTQVQAQLEKQGLALADAGTTGRPRWPPARSPTRRLMKRPCCRRRSASASST